MNNIDAKEEKYEECWTCEGKEECEFVMLVFVRKNAGRANEYEHICDVCHRNEYPEEYENEGDEDVLYQSYKCNGCNYTTSDDDPDCVKCKKTFCMMAQI